MQDFFEQVVANLKNTSSLEFVAVLAGFISVWFSRKENIWVYPTGLINTIIYIYLSLKTQLVGEASVNFYYTVMSVYGWWLWARKDRMHKPVVTISFSNKKEWIQEIIFFLFFYVTLFFILTFLKQRHFPTAIPWADAFASATAYTGMWLMARKKVESWWWWIATNIASIPLYYVKGLAFTSVYYIVLLIMAVFGLIAWKRKAQQARSRRSFDMQT
jgi:nicotinamide mononucleotide transporter